MKKKKLNISKILVVVLIFLLVYPTELLGRYVYNIASDMYLTSKKFYFESDYLKVTNPTIANDGWNGLEVYSVSYHLYSYKNDIEKLDYDLDYVVTYSTASTKIDCAIDSSFSSQTHSGTITAGTEESANTAIETLFVRPKEGETLEYNDEFEVNVEAVATGAGSDGAKYSKTLKAKYKFKIVSSEESKFTITDKNGNSYAVLTLKNQKTQSAPVTLTFDPNLIRIDTNDVYYTGVKNTVNAVTTNSLNILYRNSIKESLILADNTVSNIINTTNTYVQSGYVSQIKFYINPETCTSIKLYKKTISANYSNLGDNDTSIVTVEYE